MSLSCAVEVLKVVVVDDVLYGVPNSGRWEVRERGGRRGWGGLRQGSELGALHSTKEVDSVREYG